MTRERITLILQQDYETAEEWTCSHCHTVNPIKHTPCDCGARLWLDNTDRWWAGLKTQYADDGITMTLEQFDAKHGVVPIAQRYDTGA